MIKNQKGQTTVIFAVSILLIIFIGISVFSLGEVLVAKSRFRNVADAMAFAGASMQFNGIGSFTNVWDMNSIVSISYYMSDSALCLKDGAEALNKVAPGFDLTATSLLFSKDSVIKYTGNKTAFQNRLDQIIVEPDDPQVVTPTIFNAVQNYHSANSLILSKMIEAKNLDKNNFTSYGSLVCPSEVIYNQGPIDPSSYKWYMYTNWNSRPKYRYKKAYFDAISNTYVEVTLTGGNFSISVADSPKMMFSNLLPVSKSTKKGKIYAFSYCLSGDQTVGAAIEEPIVTCFKKLQEINTANRTRANNMTNLAKTVTASNILSIKNEWSKMIADYNGFYTYLEQNGYDDCFRIYESSYSNTPQYGSLSSLNLLELPAYKQICTDKGLDYTDPDDQKIFYKSLTFKDIFGTVENFRSAVETSIDILSADRANQQAIFQILLYNIWCLKSDHYNWNIPTMLLEYVNEAHKTENPSHLEPFLKVFQNIVNGINESYTEVYNLNSLVPTITYDFNSIKPTQAFWDLVPDFFDTPIIQIEGS